MNEIKEKQFPEVSGNNLLRAKVRFPQDFTAEYNLMLIAFYQPQQVDINTWLPFAEKLESDDPDFTYFELPIIRSLNPMARWFINEGMRTGIGDPIALARTVTLYLDKHAFRSRLGIASEDTIHIFLVSRSGEILWETRGRLDPEKQTSLEHFIQERKYSQQTLEK